VNLRIISVLLMLASALCGIETPDAVDLTPLSSDEGPARAAALKAIGASREPRLIPFLEDYRQNSAWLLDGKVVLVLDSLDDGQGQPLDPLTRVPLGALVAKSQLAEVPVRMKERRLAGEAIDRLRLADPNPVNRLNAVVRTGDGFTETARVMLVPIAAADEVPAIRRAAAEGVAMADLAVPASRAAAAGALATLNSTRSLTRLKDVLATEQDDATKVAVNLAIADITSYQSRIRVAQTIFSGLSAGSILIIMALGLSITFGLMGIINMAHGEMLMVGAYASLLVSWAFHAWLPASFMPWYFPVGVIAGFGAAGVVGWLLELTVIRHLYGRPLETLLATWGISYLLIQTVRVSFGDNQAVTAPGWLVGGWEPSPDLVLPWNRLFIIMLTAVSIIGVWLLLTKTRLGLLLRATTQSRRTAGSLGVDTRRIDGLTFALGSGLAGAAGVALTLIGGLKPDMGQEFIIDSFLTVAAGGVGNLAGVVWAGLGLGIINKLLEPFVQTVYAKVLVLGLVILFLQFRPQGIFPPRGRLADV